MLLALAKSIYLFTMQGSCLNTKMTIKEAHQYYYQLQQQLSTTEIKVQ